MAFLTHYENSSGQRINMNKSNFYAGTSANVGMIESLNGFESKNLPFYYLGAPIAKGEKKIELLAPLLDKIRNKLKGWNLKMISQRGRWVLIRSVISSLPVYLLQVCNPPLTVLKMIESLISKFFWGSSTTGKKIHWSKWSPLCLPIQEGGLGLQSLSDLCLAFSNKLLFCFREQQSLWANCLAIKYCKNSFTGDAIPKNSDSLI